MSSAGGGLHRSSAGLRRQSSVGFALEDDGGEGEEGGVTGADWDGIVRSFLEEELERTQDREQWLQHKMEVGSDMSEEGPAAAPSGRFQARRGQGDAAAGPSYQDMGSGQPGVQPGRQGGFLKCFSCFGGPTQPGGLQPELAESRAARRSVLGPDAPGTPDIADTEAPAEEVVFLPHTGEVNIRVPTKRAAAAIEEPRGQQSQYRHNCLPASWEQIMGRIDAIFNPRRRSCF